MQKMLIKDNLLFCENMKNEDAGGIGIICVGGLFISDIRLGRADMTANSSSWSVM